MQPPPTIQLSGQQSTAYSISSTHDVSGSQWGTNGIIKNNSEAWSPQAGPRGKALTDGTSPTAAHALEAVSSPPSPSMPKTSQDIIVHALSVVDGQPTDPVPEASLKKVAKKRRKQNGGVDVEHTKSNSEFLRKIQQSLIDSTGVVDNPYSAENSATSKTSESTAESKSSESNPYGYEDPDAVMPTLNTRREGMPRRRCSVTEYSLRAAHKAAAMATVMRLKRLDLMKVHSNVANEAAKIATAGSLERPFNRRRDRMGLFQTIPSSQDDNLQNDRNAAMKPPVRARSFEQQLPGLETTNAQPIGMEDRVKYGYEEHKPYRHANSDASNMNSATAASNMHGYEDPDATKTNAYGYANADPAIQPRARPRAQRRGSVTKQSIEAAQAAKAANVGAANEDHMTQIHAASTSTSEPMTIDQHHVSDSVSPQIRAPLMPTRKHSPWQSQGISDHETRISELAKNSQQLLAPSMHSMTSGSFRDTNHSNDTFESSSDEEDSAYSFNDEDSLDESLESITIPLKTGDSPKRDRLMGTPNRNGSASSFESWDSSDDVNSLALDLESVCSISQRDQRTLGRNSSGSLHAVARTASGTVPPPPTSLRTPTPRRQSRKMPLPGLTPKRSTDKLQAVSRIAAKSAHEETEESNSGRAITRSLKSSQEIMVDAPVDAMSPIPSPKILPNRPCRSHSKDKLASLTTTSTVRQI